MPVLDSNIPVDTRESYQNFYSKIYLDGYAKIVSPANRKINALANAGVLGSYKFKKILEIGGGRGWLAKKLSKRGYELSLTETCFRAVEKDLKEFRIFPYGAYHLKEFEDDSFDCVIAVDVLDATRTKKESLCIVQEAARIASQCFFCSVNGELLWKGTNLQTLKRKPEWWRDLLRHHFGKSSVEMTEMEQGQIFWSWHDKEK